MVLGLIVSGLFLKNFIGLTVFGLFLQHFLVHKQRNQLNKRGFGEMFGINIEKMFGINNNACQDELKTCKSSLHALHTIKAGQHYRLHDAYGLIFLLLIGLAISCLCLCKMQKAKQELEVRLGRHEATVDARNERIHQLDRELEHLKGPPTQQAMQQMFPSSGGCTPMMFAFPGRV